MNLLRYYENTEPAFGGGVFIENHPVHTFNKEFAKIPKPI